MTNRIALFSDIHANLPASAAVLADMAARNEERPLDGIYCLGDIGGYAGQPNEVQDVLMQGAYRTISGNYDENVGSNGRTADAGT